MFNMKIARMKKGLSQSALGEKVGVSYLMIGKYENGKAKPSLYTIEKIADALETTVDYLLGR